MNFLSIINPLAIISTISTGYGRELLDLIKIDINKIKYNNQNNICIFELGKL